MSNVRQYIGARYVPLVDGEWDNTKSYEPLTVVYYNGNSYTSRQYVPTGIDISNTDYWAQTGNYNAQIEAYRQEVWAFDGRIDALEADGSVTTSKLANNAVTNAKIADGTITPSKLDNGILIVFGDSWATSPNTWIKTYADKMKYSAFKSYAVIGAAFVNRPSNLISAQITVATNDTSINKSNVVEVIVIGGVNDYRQDSSNPTTVATGVITTLASIEELYPNAHVRYFLDCEISAYPYTWYENFCTIYNKSYDCDNLVNAMAFNTYAYNDDKLHPNGTGENLIASYLQNPVLMSFNTSVISASDFISSSANSSVNSCTMRKCKDMLITRLEIIHTADASGQITFTLPNPYNQIVFDRTHSIVSEFTSKNPGKYAIGYTGGLAAASNTESATDYVTIMTKLPY